MQHPLVGIIMGSDSDLPVMKAALDILEKLGVPAEMAIASAHRSPDVALSYARSAAERGLEVIIAGAGGAAHLPGVLAACTILPVIGVPIDSSPLNGMDALLSIVQMPPGVPVAAMAVNGARNAGIFAAQIVAVKYPAVRERLRQYKQELAEEVAKKSEALNRLGPEGYAMKLKS